MEAKLKARKSIDVRVIELEIEVQNVIKSSTISKT